MKKANLKVKCSDVNETNLKEPSEISMRKCKAFLEHCPFATPTYLVMKTGVSMTFVLANRKELGI